MYSGIRYFVSEDRSQTTEPRARARRRYPDFALWKWVSPFGYPRIKACSQLPTAFRSVPRPSSPRVPRHPPNALKALDRSHYQCPPVPGRAPGGGQAKEIRRTAFKTHRRADDAPTTRPASFEDERVLERPVSHENCPSAARVRRRQLSLVLHQDIRTTLLFTMSANSAAIAANREISKSAADRFRQLTRDLASLSGWHRRRRCAAATPYEHGGARRDRTDDLLLAKQALSQLSYGPVRAIHRTGRARRKWWARVRLELPTSPLSGVRSNHLSYRPLAGNGPKAQAPPRAFGSAYACFEERETKTARSRPSLSDRT